MKKIFIMILFVVLVMKMTFIKKISTYNYIFKVTSALMFFKGSFAFFSAAQHFKNKNACEIH